MKKPSKNQTLGILTLLGGALGILGKDKATKIAGFGTSILAGGTLLYRMYKEESKNIEAQCQETEEVFEETGLDPEKIETVSLMTGAEDGKDPEFAKTILQEIWKSSALDDEMLEYSYGAYLNTLHVMQNVEKNRVIISIPLPSKNKGSLSPQDIREFYKNLFDDFIAENKLDMKNFLNQIGVLVTKGDDDFTYYEELLREEEETFQDYIKRVISYQGDSENGKTPRGLTLKEGDKFLRIEQCLNLEFPVFPEHSNKKGLDLFSAVKLIKLLTETAYIKSGSTGREIAFDLNRIAFHPTDDYGTIFVIKGGSIVSVDL